MLKRRFMLRIFSLLLAVSLFFPACKSSKETSSTTISIDDTQWRLIELMGSPIPATMTSVNEVTLQFSKEGNRVSGFSGCNTYGGGYTTPEPSKISFSQMLSTMKACPSNMDLESAYLKMLQEVDNYAIKGNVLSLNKAKMAPMARFEAVKKKG
jgi:heat shock protein HslJ